MLLFDLCLRYFNVSPTHLTACCLPSYILKCGKSYKFLPISFRTRLRVFCILHTAFNCYLSLKQPESQYVFISRFDNKLSVGAQFKLSRNQHKKFPNLQQFQRINDHIPSSCNIQYSNSNSNGYFDLNNNCFFFIFKILLIHFKYRGLGFVFPRSHYMHIYMTVKLRIAKFV